MVKLITWGIVKSGTSNDQIHESILLEPLCKAFAGDIGGVEGWNIKVWYWEGRFAQKGEYQIRCCASDDNIGQFGDK